MVEGLVPDNGPAKRSFKSLFRTGKVFSASLNPRILGKRARNGIVTRRVKQKSCGSVKLVGAGFRNDIDDAASGASEFRIVVRRLDGNFLNAFGVENREH